jgi:very-short-patch-repair endonuclease
VGALITRGELEDRFLGFLDAFGLPRPEVNATLPVLGGTVEADCVWRGPRLVVELDGYATHAPRHAFERDRARDRALLAAGWRVARVTWRQLAADPRALAAELRALLSG